MSSRSELNKVYELAHGRKRYVIYWEGADGSRLYVREGEVTQSIEKTYRTLDEALRALRELLDAS
jgi:hypothetical protein